MADYPMKSRLFTIFLVTLIPDLGCNSAVKLHLKGPATSATSQTVSAQVGNVDGMTSYHDGSPDTGMVVEAHPIANHVLKVRIENNSDKFEEIPFITPFYYVISGIDSRGKATHFIPKGDPPMLSRSTSVLAPHNTLEGLFNVPMEFSKEVVKIWVEPNPLLSTAGLHSQYSQLKSQPVDVPLDWK